MRHGYTNATIRVGTVVVKTYSGARAAARQVIEHRAVTSLAGLMPVPEVVANEPGQLVTRFVPGRHGQELIDEGRAAAVLGGCGSVLRTLHAISPTVLFDLTPASGRVIVHGDFGPNNIMFSAPDLDVAAVLDWEFCHLGEPVEDLAWCEWIVRAHHPEAVTDLPNLFRSYGWTPPWADRKKAMEAHCSELERFSRDSDATGAGAALWVRRRQEIASWQE
ncbi:phosphotransferase [Leifsonia sp. 2MCAF36]|uniref:phosphotransferase n=1 Tax=Leifsonia sp. 2MCAF36 TaxID=3232988 RepID=UPI003F950AF3